MPTIKLVTDSTTDLPRELLEQYEVEIIPLTIYVDGQSYEDGVNIDPLEFIVKMNKSSDLPKTSQPAVGVFLDAYNRLGEDGSTVISIHMTSGMSGTYASACAAAEMSTSTVHVIDSLMMSQALGFQVLEAAEMARKGHTAESIITHIKDVYHRTSLYVVVQTLENLVKGGRIGRAKGLISSLLNIKPIVKLDEGSLIASAKVRTTAQTISKLMEYIKKDTEGKELAGIGISHANNLPLAERLKAELSHFTSAPVRIRPTTPVISTHTGEGAIGFMYYTK